MTEKTLTTDNIKPALDALRGELAPWPVVAMKQDRLNTAQLNAANSGITSSLVAQIIANTAAIRALESAITGTGLRALVVASLPAVGTTGILYIVPVTTYDPETDADVVNYSNEYIWIVAPDAPVTEGYYEQVGQTGIVINNGQLNITVNSVSVGTFTANQSGDTTAAITVPTNADYVDLTTDQTIAGVKAFSSTITGTASKAIADEDGNNIKSGYVNVAGNQTVSGDKSFTGSNTFNNILPNATSTYSLGSSSYQWSSVYAQTYYYNGTQWGLDQANTWTGSNTFTTPTLALKNTVLEQGVAPPSSNSNNLAFVDKNGDTLCYLRNRVNTDGETYIHLYAQNKYKDGQLDPTGTNVVSQFYVGITKNGVPYVVPRADTYPDINNTFNLGTSTNRWKSVYANSYYYGTTAWGLDKANEWTGDNSFTSGFSLKNTSWSGATPPSSTKTTVLEFKNSDTIQNRIASRISSGASEMWLETTRNVDSNTSHTLRLTIFVDSAGNCIFAPYNPNNTDLGTSNNGYKWKTLNGINPGALSFPDYANAVSIDTTSWSKTGSMIVYIPLISGWLQLTIPGDVGNFIAILDSGNSPLSGQEFDGNGSARIYLTYPVIANRTYWIYLKASSITTARLVPCLGNV